MPWHHRTSGYKILASHIPVNWLFVYFILCLTFVKTTRFKIWGLCHWRDCIKIHPLVGPIAGEIHKETSVFTLLWSSTANKQLGSVMSFYCLMFKYCQWNGIVPLTLPLKCIIFHSSNMFSWLKWKRKWEENI